MGGKKLQLKECPGCKSTFKPKSRHTVYCSKKCKFQKQCIPVDEKQIIKLHQEGATIGEICKRMNISLQTASRRLEKLNYSPRKENTKFKKSGGRVLSDGSRTIPIGHDLEAIVDEQDYARVSRHCWTVHKHRGRRKTIIYAQANVKIDGEWKRIMLHRFILSPLKHERIDHRDGDGLNCRRTNMRIATHNQNMQNSGSRIGSSKYKGVHWSKCANKWLAQITCNRVHYYIGLFDNEKKAAKAYDKKAKELHGEFAKLNF